MRSYPVNTRYAYSAQPTRFRRLGANATEGPSLNEADDYCTV